MSDEVMTTCQQCGRLMVAPGGYLCDHARYWLDRASLESQNQALQDRADRYETALRDIAHWGVKADAKASHRSRG